MSTTSPSTSPYPFFPLPLGSFLPFPSPFHSPLDVDPLNSARGLANVRAVLIMPPRIHYAYTLRGRFSFVQNVQAQPNSTAQFSCNPYKYAYVSAIQKIHSNSLAHLLGYTYDFAITMTAASTPQTLLVASICRVAGNTRSAGCHRLLVPPPRHRRSMFGRRAPLYRRLELVRHGRTSIHVLSSCVE